MFREIGVKVRMPSESLAQDPSEACGAPIVIEFGNSSDYRGRADALAYAVLYAKSGNSIHVFIDRVVRQGDGNRAFLTALLAHVMVHEITHLLEGVDRHSFEGVMKAVWSISDYQSMMRCPMPFAQEDVDLIRMGLARRISEVKAD